MFINASAHYIPERVISNAYYLSVNGLTDEWISSRTGIRERHRAAEDENTNTMAMKVADMLTEHLPYPKEEIDLLVGGTYTPYDTVVTLAHAVQYQLGLDPIPAVSVSSACSTFLNCMEVVEGYFAMGKAKRALVVVSEHNSAYNNDSNEKSGHLWGDGAAILSISKKRLSEDDLEILDITTRGAANVGKGTEGVMLHPREQENAIYMPHGRDVFIHACQYMAEISTELLAKHGLGIDDLDYFIPHQANRRISKKVAENLSLPESKLVSNIEYLGNTGCAGCAIGLSETHSKLKKGELVVTSVFGGGYSYGAMLIRA
ncbi:MAG: ketoacyl-ACP synthase III [Bacteroidota bacterium]